MRIHFDFSPLRYLAQKLPVLSNPNADRYSDLDRRDAIFRWPSDQPAWEVAEEDRKQVRRLGQSRPPDADLDEKMTVAEAVAILDGWFVGEVRRLLPESVVRLLTRWLSEQWGHFSTDPLPEDYLWSYLSLLGDGGTNRTGVRCTIPPLVGRIEVAAYEISNGGEDGPQTDWLNGRRFVHLCDRMNEIFYDYRYSEDENSNWVRGESGRPERSKRSMEEGWLWIDHRAAGMTRRWMEERNNFAYWPGAMQATEHWILRLKEVDQPRAERTISRTFREPLAQSISLKLPRVWQTILHTARAIDDGWCRVLPPIWFDEGFLLGAVDWAAEQIRDRRTHGGRRISNIASTSFLSDDNPRTEQIGEGIRWLRDRPEPDKSRPNSSVFNNSFSSWEEANLFVADLTEVKRQQLWEGQQTLFELHRRICESLETVIRQRFKEARFTPDDKDFARAFRQWVATERGIDNIELIDKKMYTKDFKASLGENVGNLQNSVPKLEDLIDNIISTSNASSVLKGLGLELQTLLRVETLGPCSTPSAWRDAVDSVNPVSNLSDLLLAAKILIEIRNKLGHGTIDDYQPQDDEVVVLNHEKKFCIRLTQQSLEYCFRLLVPLISVFHDEADLDEKSVWWSAYTWLEAYQRATPGVERDRLSTNEMEPFGRCYSERLAFTQVPADSLQRGNPVGKTCPKLVVRVERSQNGFDIKGYADHHRSCGTQELMILFVQERECFWLERLPGPNPDFFVLRGSDGGGNPSPDGILRSNCFPGLWLDKKALFEQNQARLNDVLGQGLKSKDHAAMVQRLQ